MPLSISFFHATWKAKLFKERSKKRKRKKENELPRHFPPFSLYRRVKEVRKTDARTLLFIDRESLEIFYLLSDISLIEFQFIPFVRFDMKEITKQWSLLLFVLSRQVRNIGDKNQTWQDIRGYIRFALT